MEPYKITVVIEAPTEAVGLGRLMLGGKITALAVGDKIEVANNYEPPELVVHGKKHKAYLSGVVPPIRPHPTAQALPEGE